MKTMNFMIGLLITLMALFSCNDDNDVNAYVGWGTVERRSSQYYIRFDGAGTHALADSALLVLHGAQRPGQRVIAGFTVAKRQDTASLVDVYQLYKVLTKPIFQNPSQEESDSLGHDRIQILSAWVSGGHLNVRFRYMSAFYTIRPHFISMVCHSRALPVLDVVDLEFRHNAQGAPRDRWRNGYVSFPIPELLNKASSFRISYRDMGGAVRSIIVRHHPLADDVSVSVDFPVDGEEIF